MKTISADEVHAKLDYASVVEELRAIYREGCDIVDRIVFSQPAAQGGTSHFLLLPAWQKDRHIGVKLVSVFPGNEAKGLASVLGTYVLIDGSTGEPMACIDGTALTLRKTASNSALAATYLAREDSARLVMVGAGALAPHMVRAHAAVRPIGEVLIWNRTPARARQLARSLAGSGVEVRAIEDLEAAAREADVISCATMTVEPLIHGAWLRPGTHVDLVGGFRPEMREADDEAVRRARVYVDTPFVFEECGDISQPIARGVISREEVVADLFALARGEKPGRRSAEEITLFKNGGGGIQDLAAARLLVGRIA